MPTVHTRQGERVLDTVEREGDLPALTTVDRLALWLGLRLILWGQHHADAARRDQRIADRAAAARDEAFQRHALFGHTW